MGRCQRARTASIPGMFPLATHRVKCGIWGIVCMASFVHAGAQLVRQPASLLNLPSDLPIATGYTTQNALGALTFAAPMLTADPGDHSDRLFVAERGGTIQVVTGLSTTPVKASYFNL